MGPQSCGVVPSRFQIHNSNRKPAPELVELSGWNIKPNHLTHHHIDVKIVFKDRIHSCTSTASNLATRLCLLLWWCRRYAWCIASLWWWCWGVFIQQPTLEYLYPRQQGLLTPASFKTKHMGHPAMVRAMTASTLDRATQVTARTITEVTIIRQSQALAPATQVTATGAMPSGKLMASLGGRDQRYW